ncbi:MAG: factor-independent urate hydroxylase [Stackebrandtia sp.]
MAFRLAANQYGKAETRLVHVDRADKRHVVTDLNVSVALTGDLIDTHLTGDNSHVLPTDTQKNTVYAFARDGIGEVEAFGMRLARHFVDSHEPIHSAHVSFEEHAWERIGDHSFTRAAGGEVRTVDVVCDGEGVEVSAGLKDLLLLNSTDSEFTGYIVDEYTTLPPATDRVLATEVSASWTYSTSETDFAAAYARARRSLVDAFADTYSLSLQQTLYSMGARVLQDVPQASRVSLSLPNKHHFLCDLEPFGMDNPGLVFHAADRPYGLIEGTVTRS